LQDHVTIHEVKTQELKNKKPKKIKKNLKKNDKTVVTSRHCHMIDEIKMFSVCAELPKLRQF